MPSAMVSPWSRWPTCRACACCPTGGRWREPRRATARVRSSAPRSTRGRRRIVLGIGGSASTDGGAGLVQALGARLLDARGRQIGRGGAALAAVESLDLAGLHPAPAKAEVVVASDVDNPLLGPRGAAAVYGPQKGASPADVAELDAALSQWAQAVRSVTGDDVADRPGAGAAGGVGFAALAVLAATLRPGIDLVLDLVGFRAALPGAGLVVTGEGSLDEQTLHGKAPAGVAAAAARQTCRSSPSRAARCWTSRTWHPPGSAPRTR
jgi:glycerate kinase